MQPIRNSGSLLIKVCGMREPANIAAVAELCPDFLGFIFHRASPRYAGAVLRPELLRALPESVRKIGVFVDESPATILATLGSFGLDGAQLHGQEPPTQCAALRQHGVLVIKSFGVSTAVDWEAVRPYVGLCDYFLFDTHGPAPGGNGTAFDWEVLRSYPFPTPYLLAGGLSPDNVAAVAALQLPGLAGVDLNSRFETAPACKNLPRLTAAFAVLRETHVSAPQPQWA